MHPAYRKFALTAVLMLASASSRAGAAAPEIERPPGSTAAQPVGQVHTLRNIPEACVRLEGLFTGEPATPYQIKAVSHQPCAQRAEYVEAATLKRPPAASNGWILNDRINVPRADLPACMATVEVWRWQGHVAPPALDPQGRSRIYLDKPQKAADLPAFTATLAVGATACRGSGQPQ